MCACWNSDTIGDEQDTASEQSMLVVPKKLSLISEHPPSACDNCGFVITRQPRVNIWQRERDQIGTQSVHNTTSHENSKRTTLYK